MPARADDIYEPFDLDNAEEEMAEYERLQEDPAEVKKLYISFFQQLAKAYGLPEDTWKGVPDILPPEAIGGRFGRWHG